MNNPHNKGSRPQESPLTGFIGLLFFFILAVIIAGFLSGRESIRYFPSPIDRQPVPTKEASNRVMLLPYTPEVQDDTDSEITEQDWTEDDWEVADQETTPFSIMWPESQED